MIADALIAIAGSSRVNQPHSIESENQPMALWPRIIACIAFDTPYYGINPDVFKNTASKAVQYVQTAHKLAAGLGVLGTLGVLGGNSKNKKTAGHPEMDGKSPDERNTIHLPSGSEEEEETAKTAPAGATSVDLTSHTSQPSTSADTASTPNASTSRWHQLSTPALIYSLGGATLAGAAAGTAFYKRKSIAVGISQAQANVDWAWAGDHLKYVRNLWDDKALKDRVEMLIKLRSEWGVFFQK